MYLFIPLVFAFAHLSVCLSINLCTCVIYSACQFLNLHVCQYDYQFVFLSISQTVLSFYFLPVCPSTHLLACLSVSVVCQSTCLSFHPWSVSQMFCAFLPVCPHVCLVPVFLSVLLVSLSALCLSFCLSCACLPVCLL